MDGVKVLLLAVVMLLLVGCSALPWTEGRTQFGAGLSFAAPSGWHVEKKAIEQQFGLTLGTVGTGARPTCPDYQWVVGTNWCHGEVAAVLGPDGATFWWGAIWGHPGTPRMLPAGRRFMTADHRHGSIAFRHNWPFGSCPGKHSESVDAEILVPRRDSGLLHYVLEGCLLGPHTKRGEELVIGMLKSVRISGGL